MADFDFNEINAEPTLTFGEEEPAESGTAAAEAALAAAMEAPAPAPKAMEFSEAILTEEEKKQMENFAKKIDLTNTKAIMEYGAGTQKKMAEFSEKTLETVKTKDMGETGKLISNLVTELKDFDVAEDEKGLKGFFKKKGNQLINMRAKYNKVEANVDEICKVLEGHQVQLLKDVDVLDRMYDLNQAYFKEITMYILAGKKALANARETKLVELQQKAQASGLAEDAQAAKDYAALCDRFEKKIYDLELTRTVSLQTAPQIRLVQNSDTIMAEKIQSTLVNTIPLWKNQMVIAIGIEHSNQAAAAQKAVTDTTNELLKKNAKALETASIEVAKEAERGIVDIETLAETNQTLINTLDSVLEIQKEGKNKRIEAEAELARIEAELKNKLIEMAKN